MTLNPLQRRLGDLNDRLFGTSRLNNVWFISEIRDTLSYLALTESTHETVFYYLLLLNLCMHFTFETRKLFYLVYCLIILFMFLC